MKLQDSQRHLENAIDTLVNEFLKRPYAFFTEADSVARFHQLLTQEPTFNNHVQSADGYDVSLIHREYLTFFCFDDKNPIARLDSTSKARRGRFLFRIKSKKDTEVGIYDEIMMHSFVHLMR
jgi:hypothetical protein